MARKFVLSVLIRSRLDDYEARLAVGWTYQMFIDELKDEGFIVSTRYFSRCIVNARRLGSASSRVKSPAPIAPIKSSKMKPIGQKSDSKEIGNKPFKISALSDDDLF